MVRNAKIKKFKGAPSLFIDNKPIPAFWLFGPVEVLENFAKRKTGVHLFQFVSDLGWINEGKYNYNEIDKKIERVIEKDPKSLIVIQTNMNTPDWWNKLHPEELTLYIDGDKKLNDRTTPQSYASDLWWKEGGKALEVFVKHTRKKYSDNIIGFSLGVGFAGEWHKDLAQEGIPWDYSSNMVKKFRSWVREKYNNNLNELRKSWKNKSIDFDQIKIPDPRRHIKGDLYMFHDPAKSQNVIDYFLFRSNLVINTAIHFCTVAKKAGDDGTIIGLVSIGYIMDQMPGAFFSEERFINYDKNMTHNWSQSNLYKLLQSKNVDFIGGWTCNLYRSIGGDASSVTVPESIMLHDKLYHSEFDARTYLAGDRLGRATDVKESIEVNRRDFLNVWLKGAGKVAANLGPGTWYWPNVPLKDWYDDKNIVNDMALTQRIAEKSMELDRSPFADIAVVVDEQSQAYHTISDYLMYPLTTKLKTYELVRIGAPYHTYLLDDILYSDKIPNYKFYIFINAFNLDRKRREILKKKLMKNRNVLLWIYASGISDGNRLAGRNISDITGIKTILDDEQWGLNVTVSNYEHIFTHNLETNLTFGTDNLVGPVVFAKDSNAIVLGKIHYSNGRSEAGFCVKHFKDYTSVWVGAPLIPAKILRNIAKYAGVHIFNSESDVLYANSNFVSLHTLRAGNRKINLPYNSDIIDVFEGRIVATNTNSFVDFVPANITKLYYYGNIKGLFKS